MQMSKLLAENGLFPVCREDRAELTSNNSQAPQAQNAEGSGD